MTYIFKKRVVFFGDSGSGKTYLLVSICNDDPKGDYVCTTESNGKEVRLLLCDTNSYCDRLLPLYLYGTDIVVLCFAIDEPDSLKNIEEFWMPLIKQYHPTVPLILVANKVDLRTDPATILKISSVCNRPVSKEDGRNMAVKIGACYYFECSATTKASIQELIQSIAEKATMNSSSEPKKKKDVCLIS